MLNRNLLLIGLVLWAISSDAQVQSIAPASPTLDNEALDSNIKESPRLFLSMFPFIFNRVEVGADFVVRQKDRLWIYGSGGYAPARTRVNNFFHNPVDPRYISSEVHSFSNFDFGLAYKYNIYDGRRWNWYAGVFGEVRQESFDMSSIIDSRDIDWPGQDYWKYEKWNSEEMVFGGLLSVDYQLNSRFGMDAFVSAGAKNTAYEYDVTHKDAPFPYGEDKHESGTVNYLELNVGLQLSFNINPVPIPPKQIDTVRQPESAPTKFTGQLTNFSVGTMVFFIPKFDYYAKIKNLKPRSNLPISRWTRYTLAGYYIPDNGGLVYGSVSAVWQWGGTHAAEFGLGLGMVYQEDFLGVLPLPDISLGYKWTSEERASGKSSVFRLSTGFPHIVQISYGFQKRR